MRLLYSIVAVSTLFYTLALSLDTWATAHEQYEDPSVAVDFEFGLRKVYLDYQFSNQPKTSRDVDYEEFCDNIGFITKGGDCDKLTEGEFFYANIDDKLQHPKAVCYQRATSIYAFHQFSVF
eukprot:TRINITY_DN4148_c0_g2_i5.p1 TRINITY_DN4148_c0_g2~~TRINITY_DN4148_c0_g2_i5.p1  ORF type:complete len:122 (-),score=18.88 TRINITY_DN4148_c0_g2_i5:516-881(-)